MKIARMASYRMKIVTHNQYKPYWRPTRRPCSDLLNVLTVSHVIMGYMNFRCDCDADNRATLRLRLLTKSEIVRLEAAQSRRCREMITECELAHEAEKTIGDTVAQTAFCGFEFLGTVLRRDARNRYGSILKLDRSQILRADGLVRTLRDMIDAMRASANRRILTPTLARALTGRSKQAALEAMRKRQIPLLLYLVADDVVSADEEAHLRVELSILRGQVRNAHRAIRLRFIRILTRQQREYLRILEDGGPAGR